MTKPPISDTFAAQLTTLRAQLLAQLRAERGGPVSRADAAAEQRSRDPGDAADVAKADTERDLAVALSERESAELQTIDAALQRIADGSYGLCVDCGVTIPTARLHANPTALRCVACQEGLEQAQGGLHPAT